MKYKAVLFDMDGTLTDTEPVGMQVLLEMLKSLGVELSEDEITLFDKVWRRDGTDMEFEEFIERLTAKYPSIESEPFIEQFFINYESAITVADKLPGVDELLHDAKSRGYLLAIVTASNDSQAQAVVKKHGWENIFDLVLTQDSFKTKKPSPACYLMAAERLRVEPKECIVVEDSKNGAQAGKNAGMYVIGVRAGNKHAQDLSTANQLVERLSDIKLEEAAGND